MKKLVLASASPRRSEILSNLGVDFIVDPAEEFIEIQPDNHSPEALVGMNAQGKARELAMRHKNAIIMGIDTIGLFNGEILEKPKDKEDAFRMLNMLQGNTHEVLSSICLINTSTGEEITETERTSIEFHPLTKDQINSYIETGEPMDKAASYAIQGIGSLFTKRIDGDYLNVVGLPVQLLNQMLSRFDFNILDALK